MVRRSDVATLAGVTPAVVSYVTNGSHPVSEATRARVLEAIEQLGYRPNPIARALATSRTHAIGLLLPDLANPFFAELAAAIERAAFKAGYTLVLGTPNESKTLDHYISTFAERMLDGLIVAPVTDTAARAVDQAKNLRIPIVFTDRVSKVHGAAVVVDNVSGARVATRHLISHDRHVHACITGEAQESPAAGRAAGWRQALETAGEEFDPSRLVFTDFTAEAAYEAADSLLTADPDIDAMLIGSDQQALGVLRALYDRGRVPGVDVSLVSFDGTSAGKYTTPRLTSVAQPFEAVAAAVIDLLEGLIESPEGGATDGITRMLPTELVIRESCGCYPQGGQAGDRSDAAHAEHSRVPNEE